MVASLLVTLLVATAADPALAQLAAPITPPVAPSATNVAYPPAASGDSVVLLELVVAPDGTVSDAKVLEGVEPFSEQARRAVLTWQFVPAMRGTTPIAARIRARVEFHQELPPAAAATAPPRPQPAAPEARAEVTEAPLDVTVRGQRREIGQTTLSAADAREMPGAFGDPFRAIEALPAVTPIVSGLPYFSIRGAPPNDNGYYLDGIRIPFLFHVGIGEAVVHPALIDHVDFFPSAAPAAYGDAAGAIIAGQTRAPATKTHGEANLRLFDAGALAETTFGEGRGSVLIAGRYGYPGPILSALTDNVKLGYWDYQARVTWRLDDRNTLSVFAFGSHDYLGTALVRNGEPGPILEQLASDFHRIDLRYDHALGGGTLRIATTLGRDAQGGAGLNENAVPSTVFDLSVASRIELDDKLSSSLRLRAGVSGHYDRYSLDEPVADASQAPVINSADPPPTNVGAAAHADLVWRLSPRVEIVPGLRGALVASWRNNDSANIHARTTVPALDPRVSARVTITPRVAWLATAALAHQYPALRLGAVPGLFLTVPGFPLGDAQLQRALQLSQGIEVALPADITLTANGFLSAWSGLTDVSSLCIQIMPPTTPPPTGMGDPQPPPYTCPGQQPVHGYAYGGELLVRRPLSKRLAGWVSYTLSRSIRQQHFITLDGSDALATVRSDYDRTHVLNAVVAYDLGRHWRMGSRVVFYSGAPYSDLAGNVPVPPYNGHRGPPFFRLDVRLEKRWPLGKDRSIALIIEGQNVTLTREATPFGLDCMGTMTPQGGTNQCTEGRIGPLTIPSIGVDAVF